MHQMEGGLMYYLKTWSHTLCYKHLGTDTSLIVGHNAYSYDRQLVIFYMHYQIDMIIHGTAFVAPVGSTLDYMPTV